MKSGNRSIGKRLFYSPLGIVLACIVLFFLVRGSWSIHEKAILAEEHLSQSQAELNDLEDQQSSLSASIAQLSTTEGIEAELREKYHAVKSGESVAVIIDTSSAGSSTEDAGISSVKENSWWESLLQTIGF